MRLAHLCSLLVVLTLSTACLARELPVIGKITRTDPRLNALLAPDAKIEVLASGLDWTEGPVWVKDDGYLLFSVIPQNAIMKFQPGKGLSQFMKPAGYTGVVAYGAEPGSNGLAVDSKGRLVLCEHGDRRISRLEHEGGKRTLADNYGGKRFNSPNDLVIKSNGDIYFTDPPYGLPNGWEDKRRELDFCGVFRVSPEGMVTLLTRELTRPNGIAFSADEKTLYVANSDPKQATYISYEVTSDGTLGKGKLFFDATSMVRDDNPGLPDGLKVDKHGNVWATGPGGVYVFDPHGRLLGSITTGEACGNCTWGDDGSTLYIVSDMYLCRVKTSTHGAGW